MELYASGFNAWGQLCFDDFNNSKNEEADADDIRTFTSVLRVDTSSEVRVRAFLSYTSVICDGRTRIAGYFPSEHKKLRNKGSRAYETLAEASNGSVTYIDPEGAVCQLISPHHVLRGVSGHTFPGLPACKQLVAYETGFMSLTLEGDVYTWGDERYGACLGREPSKDSPADEPGMVIALHDLPTGPIVKIAAGGYALAALTKGNDLYLWGGHPGRKTVPTDLSDEPAPVDIGDDDIADVAVGESHILIFTISGRLLAVGENTNGQLGSLGESVESWTLINLDLPVGSRIAHVVAGPRNSFVLVKRDDPS